MPIAPSFPGVISLYHHPASRLSIFTRYCASHWTTVKSPSLPLFLSGEMIWPAMVVTGRFLMWLEAMQLRRRGRGLWLRVEKWSWEFTWSSFLWGVPPPNGPTVTRRLFGGCRRNIIYILQKEHYTNPCDKLYTNLNCCSRISATSM